MGTLLNLIKNTVLTSVAGYLGAAITALVQKFTKKTGVQIEQESVKHAMDVAEAIVLKIVKASKQRVIDDCKKAYADKKITRAEALEILSNAKKEVVKQAKALIAAPIQATLRGAVSDVDALLDSMVEASVSDIK